LVCCLESFKSRLFLLLILGSNNLESLLEGVDWCDKIKAMCCCLEFENRKGSNEYEEDPLISTVSNNQIMGNTSNHQTTNGGINPRRFSAPEFQHGESVTKSNNSNNNGGGWKNRLEQKV